MEPFPRVGSLPSPLLADMAIHAFDQARSLAGADAVRWEGSGSAVVERLVEHTPEGPRFERSTLGGDVDPNDHPAAVPALLGR